MQIGRKKHVRQDLLSLALSRCPSVFLSEREREKTPMQGEPEIVDAYGMRVASSLFSMDCCSPPSTAIIAA